MASPIQISKEWRLFVAHGSVATGSQYRINHVKKLFEDKEYFNSTIINIAYDSGFNSKSAFNTAFKKQTGMTPSAYRKQIGQSI